MQVHTEVPAEVGVAADDETAETVVVTVETDVTVAKTVTGAGHWNTAYSNLQGEEIAMVLLQTLLSLRLLTHLRCFRKKSSTC